MAQRTVSIVIEVAGAEDAVRQVRQMRSALDDLGAGKDSIAQVFRQSREVTQAMKEMEKTFHLRQQQKEMVGDLEDFFRRILTGARTTGDVFKNIWKEVADFFRRTIQEMSAASTLTLGGVLPLLTGGSGGIPPTLAATLGLPATMPAGDSLGQLRGIGPFSGAQVALGGSALGSLTVGNRSRLVSTLGGIGSGAMLGFSVGGPIGAAIGAIAGGLIGLFSGGGGKEKRHDAEIANRGFAQLTQILDDYNHFRRDFASSVDAANRIWSQMQSQWTRPQSASSQRPYFDAILRSLQATEDERNRRRQLQALMPVPEFAAGGFVSAATPSLSRGLLAVVHPGEFVLNQQAVDRMGISLLEGINRGTAGGSPAHAASGLQISLEPASAQTLGEMLKRNPQALEEGLLVVLRRGGAASRALRG